jgi:flagellar hook-associated protein 3 FlgL
VITPVAMTDLFLNDIETVTGRLTQEEAELATGLSVTTPSDNPAAAATNVQITAAENQNSVFTENAQDAVSWLQETEQSLQNVSTYLSRAYQLAIQASNGATSTADLQAIAQEVESIVQVTEQVEDQTYRGVPLFGGTTGSLPVPGKATSPASQPSAQPFTHRIDTSLVIPVSTTDYAAFWQTNVVPSLTQLESDLTSNPSNLGADAQAIQNAQSSLLAVVAGLSANEQLAQTEISRLQNSGVTLQKLQQETVGADAAAVMTSYARDQNIYQEAVATAARILQPSLLDYLR